MYPDSELDFLLTRINALATSRFLRAEARHWFFSNRLLEIANLIIVSATIYGLLNDLIQLISVQVALAIIFFMLIRNTLSDRFCSGDCYVEGYRQGFIDAAIDHWEPLLLTDEERKSFLQSRIEEMEIKSEMADKTFMRTQESYMRQGQSNAISYFSKSYRTNI